MCVLILIFEYAAMLIWASRAAPEGDSVGGRHTDFRMEDGGRLRLDHSIAVIPAGVGIPLVGGF